MIPGWSGLNCLSAVEAIGSPSRSVHSQRRVGVSIAFRLLKRLVGEVVGKSPRREFGKVSIAFRLLKRLVVYHIFALSGKGRQSIF